MSFGARYMFEFDSLAVTPGLVVVIPTGYDPRGAAAPGRGAKELDLGLGVGYTFDEPRAYPTTGIEAI